MTLTGFVRFTHPHVHISATFISKSKSKDIKARLYLTASLWRDTKSASKTVQLGVSSDPVSAA